MPPADRTPSDFWSLAEKGPLGPILKESGRVTCQIDFALCRAEFLHQAAQSLSEMLAEKVCVNKQVEQTLNTVVSKGASIFWVLSFLLQF